MIPDERDTIVAVASPRAGAARGVIRISGPRAMEVVRGLLNEPLEAGRTARRLANQRVTHRLAGREQTTPCDVYLWPTTRSYTRQPSAELHTLGSPPLVDAVVEAACQAGARLAEPGEFTLRAFLAGRIDLTQAEAVLGVIDAPGGPALQSALEQLAGGLSTPLAALRDDLTQLLAELEAGLDFVEEEDIRFIETDELITRLAAAERQVAGVAAQAVSRGRRGAIPRVALVGPPNAGKSSLFNALRVNALHEQAEVGGAAAIVSDVEGTTRDSLAAEIVTDGQRFILLDTAGIGETLADGPAAIADAVSRRDAAAADLRLACEPLGKNPTPATDSDADADTLLVWTKADRGDAAAVPASGCATSSKTGDGIDKLLAAVATRLSSQENLGQGRLIAATAERCRQSLTAAAACLKRAAGVALAEEHDLVALEIRAALEQLGRVVGAVVTDDILDRIFGQFCIGK